MEFDIRPNHTQRVIRALCLPAIRDDALPFGVVVQRQGLPPRQFNRKRFDNAAEVVDVAIQRGVDPRDDNAPSSRRLDQMVCAQHGKGSVDRLARDIQPRRQGIFGQTFAGGQRPDADRVHKRIIGLFHKGFSRFECLHDHHFSPED
jgi:hypothetical protein